MQYSGKIYVSKGLDFPKQGSDSPRRNVPLLPCKGESAYSGKSKQQPTKQNPEPKTTGFFVFYREAERAWKHCRSSKAVSLKKLVKTSLALAKQTKQGGKTSKSQPHKTPKQRPRQVPELGETCETRVKR